ncbi:TusE/DsrC/DsvC family sulfur relay protein [Patescibacteria group bacterium]|nr:TusE/DsrC/DsvC family sulfur relay protein [Patescibacteria group bacterium]
MINFLREYYTQHKVNPDMTALENFIRSKLNGRDEPTKIAYALFPGGPLKIGMFISGLPKPIY